MSNNGATASPPRKTLSTEVCWAGRSVRFGGGAPVVVQAMTDTPTADVAATFAQVRALHEAGAEMVRITVNDREAARAVPRLREKLDAAHCLVPLIGDFHYNGQQLLEDCRECAEALSKYRINPGNTGAGERGDANFARIIAIALRYDKPVRIGVNWGSLDAALQQLLFDENARRPDPLDAAALLRETLLASALQSAKRAEELGMPSERIVLSCKVSDAPALIALYRELAARCSYALHLGLTEAGMGASGLIASSAALAPLLLEGIGETIRISLTPEPGQDRCAEVRAAWLLLQSLGLRSFMPKVSACPGCGRTASDAFQSLASTLQTWLQTQQAHWRQHYPGAERLKIAVMGCIVNGPGESRHADIGISLPGRGEADTAMVFIDGQRRESLRGENLALQFQGIVERYVQQRFGAAH